VKITLNKRQIAASGALEFAPATTYLRHYRFEAGLLANCGFRRRQTIIPKEAEQHSGLKANTIGA